jgi:ABC-type sugar transport system permease subunit
MTLKRAEAPFKLSGNLTRFRVFLFILGILGLFIRQLYIDGHWLLFGVFTLVFGWFLFLLFAPRFFAFRWLSSSLVLLLVMAVYPIVFTVYTSFTNYSDGHLLTRNQVIRLLEQQTFIPPEVITYQWIGFRSDQGRLGILIAPDQVDLQMSKSIPKFLDTQGLIIELDAIQSISNGPQEIDRFTRLSRVETIQRITDFERGAFGNPDEPFRVQSLHQVAQVRQRFTYDSVQRQIMDNQRNLIYREDRQRGAFVAYDGSTLRPGFQTPVGFRNYIRLFTNRAIREPFLEIFIWTFSFALLSTGLTFGLGMVLALTFESKPWFGKKIIRSVLILPQALPGVIGILMWRGLLNPHTGVITQFLQQMTQNSPQWFADPWAARFAVVIINLWLGYPYMLLIVSGALQSIPKELYEAAKVDGANSVTRFSSITFPLLLLAVGPVLIATFTMNINNFNVIYLFNNGGPPMANSATPAGHTDILISYTYRLAFEGLRGSDYGFAAAITVIIFLLLTIVTLVNMRKTRIWEEMSTNG